jgi:ferrochelatase
MNQQRDPIGVLVMSYGTPESLEQVEAYYTHIRRGIPPAAEQLQELIDRYDAIVGGFFPLRENTNKQVAAIQAKLDELYGPGQFICYQGLKHAHPFIEDGVEAIAGGQFKRAISIVLAPHYSSMSVGSYNKRAKETAAQLGLPIHCIDNYHMHPKLIQALTQRVENALSKFTEVNREDVRVIFTAHSLPERILQINDPYVDQLHETSHEIARQVGITNWQFGWQSAGRTREPWLGPDILDTLRAVHDEEGVRHVLICPVGFVSDHLEVLYDLDIEAKQLAAELGMHLERTASLNTDPLYIETLCDVINQTAEMG